MRRILRSILCVGTIGPALGCAPKHPADSSTVVVGVQSEELGGAVSRVHVTASVDGEPKSDETLTLVSGGPPVFPHEIALVSGNAGAKIEVKIEAFPPPGNFPPGQEGAPVLVRSASSTFVQGQVKLLRLRLEARCLLALGVGGIGAPVCRAPQTCQSGRCADDSVLAGDLEAYEPNWAVDAPDICRPVNHGPPQVIVGTGQTDFASVTDGQVLQAELGPQRGHHLWIAVRMRNLKQSGSTTTITGVQPGTNLSIPPTSFVFTFDRDEGGYCKLYGLRYQLDNGGIDYKQFLGKPLDVSVEVHDVTGTTWKSVAHINVAPTVLGE